MEVAYSERFWKGFPMQYIEDEEAQREAEEHKRQQEEEGSEEDEKDEEGTPRCCAPQPS